MSEVVRLHQDRPTSEVPATLRRIADEIEAGTYRWPVTTCVIALGHSDAEVLVGNDTLMQEHHWATYAAGPRCDSFTVRGLLATLLWRGWNSPDE